MDLVSKIILGLIIGFIILIILTTKIHEGFDGIGMYIRPPNWFIKPMYDPKEWLVNTSFNAIQPECLSYDKGSKYGSLENINYLASATRFWRF